MVARLAERLATVDLDPAHYITALFWVGFERGHRWRQAVASMVSSDAARRSIATLGAMNIGEMAPLRVGFDMGYAFEPMRADGEGGEWKAVDSDSTGKTP